MYDTFLESNKLDKLRTQVEKLMSLMKKEIAKKDNYTKIEFNRIKTRLEIDFMNIFDKE